MAGIGNGLIVGYVMYRSGLMPRRLAMLGLLAGSLHIIGSSPCCSECSMRVLGRSSSEGIVA
jgi:hypothetical protein